MFLFQKEQLPRVEHGYYYFVDRQAESEQQTSDEQILERVSYNFSIAIYDTDTDTLYYVEADSDIWLQTIFLGEAIRGLQDAYFERRISISPLQVRRALSGG